MDTQTQALLQIIADWLAAIGTLLAVIVALYLARRDRLIRCVADSTVYVLLDPARSDFPHFVTFTVTNIGTRPFTLTGFHWQTGVISKKYFYIVPPENQLTSRLPIKLTDGEQASIYIPLEDFRNTTLPTLLKGQGKHFIYLRVQFMRLIVNTTTGQSMKFKIGKTLRDEIVGKKSQ